MSTQTTTTEAASGAEGFVLVPEEATEAMWQAGAVADAHPGDSYSAVYRAMIAAAPVTGTGGGHRELRAVMRRLSAAKNAGGIEDAETQAQVLGHAVDACIGHIREFLATAPQPADAERVDLDRDHVANEIENIARAWRGANGGIYTIHAMSLELADWAIARSASLPAALGSGEGTAGATPMGSGSRPSDQAASHPTPAGFDPSRGELLAALEPFARAARGIPSDLPDSLWTSCDSYPWHMPQDAYEAMKADGIPLLDRSTNLSLWIDGHPLSDFRRTADVYARLAAQGTEAGTAETGTGSVHEGPVSEADAPHPQSPSLSKVKGPYRTGRKVRRNVYRFDEPVFMAGSESEAVWLVAVLNAGEAVLRPSPTLTASQEQDGEVRA